MQFEPGEWGRQLHVLPQTNLQAVYSVYNMPLVDGTTEIHPVLADTV